MTEHKHADAEAHTKATSRGDDPIVKAKAFDLLMDKLEGTHKVVATKIYGRDSVRAEWVNNPPNVMFDMDYYDVYEWKIRLDRSCDLRNTVLLEAITVLDKEEENK